MIQLISAVEPKAIVRVTGWHRVNIDVLDNGEVFIGYSKQDLATGISTFLGGKPVDKNHPYQDWFEGELWIVASIDQTAINILVWPSTVITV